MDNALEEWERSIFTIVDKRIKFNSQNTNTCILPPVSSVTKNFIKSVS